MPVLFIGFVSATILVLVFVDSVAVAMRVIVIPFAVVGLTVFAF